MTKLKRLPQAPSEPLPELAGFLAPFRLKFTFDRSFTSLERYLTGLLTEHPQKNCDTLAQVVPGTTQQNLQYLLTALVWDEQALNRQRIEQMLQLPSEAMAYWSLMTRAQKRYGFGRCGAPVYGQRRESVQLSGDGQLPLCRTHAGLARCDASLPAARLDG